MDRHGEILQIIEDGGPQAFNQAEGDTRNPQAVETINKLRAYFQPPEYSYRVESGWRGITSFAKQILEESVSESTPSLLEKLAVMIAGVDRRGWDHAVCHLFEKYGREQNPPSLLKDSRLFPAADILVNAAIERGIGDNFSRIAGPIAQYNLDAIEKNGLEQPFAFRPESLSAPSLQTLEKDSLWAHFVLSDTPKTFIKSLADNPPARLGNNIKPLILILNREYGRDAVRELLEKSMTSANPPSSHDYQSNHFFASSMQVSGEDQWIERAIASAQAHSRWTQGDITPGLFVDVEETLLVNGELNVPLAAYLSYLLDQDAPVTVFTGGDAEKLSEELEKSGMDARVLPVRNKKDFYGRQLEILIDDTPFYYQPFGVNEYIEPFYGKDKTNKFDPDVPHSLINKWGQPPKLTADKPSDSLPTGKSSQAPGSSGPR